MSVLTRVKAALRRLSPVWPSTEVDTSVGKEIDSIATAIEPIATVLDTLLDETFPDTTDQLIARWERVCRVPTRPADSLAVRRERVLSVLRRTSGPRIEQLSKMLAGPFDLDENDIIFVETLRDTIEDALTFAVPDVTYPTGTTTIYVNVPWPGEVDSFGVRVTLEADLDQLQLKIYSPQGTEWDIGDLNPDYGWGGEQITFWDRETFTDEIAGGAWRIEITVPADTELFGLTLLVSNDVDSAQIYRFFALRDVDLAGSPDMVEAERLFRRTALGHLDAHVINRLECIVDDAYSRCDREPCGD